MAYIRTLPPEEADDELRAQFDQVRDPRTGQLDEILAVHSLHPAGLSAHFRLYRTVMRGTKGLPAVDREMVALLVSRLNGCEY